MKKGLAAARPLMACVALLLSPVAAASSALFTKGAGDVQTRVSTNAGESVVLFSHTPAGEESRALAMAWQGKQGEGARTVIGFFPPSAPRLSLIGLEHLYEYVLHQDAAGTFEFHDFAGKVTVGRGGSTHAEVLRSIAFARDRAVADLVASGSGLKPIPWSVVSMEAVAASTSRNADPDEITVRVANASGSPIAAARLTATRGADMMCSGKSDAHGVVSCKLMDMHGHAPGQQDDDGDAPVIVMFAGAVSAERIDLPTTLVVAKKRAE